MKPMEIMETREHMEQMERLGPMEQMEPMEKMGKMEQKEHKEQMEQMEQTGQMEATKPIKQTEQMEPSEAVEPTELMQSTKLTKPTKPTKATKPMESTEQTEPTEPMQPTDATEPTKPMEPEPMKEESHDNGITDDAPQRKRYKRGIDCGTKCVNRIGHIECELVTCPCTNTCKNQRIQKGNEIEFALTDYGEPKGWGVVTLDSIKKEDFVGEYMGEIIPKKVYLERYQEIRRHEKHQYCMELNQDEVIDASRYASIPRYFNHSCDPNCYAEKWNVAGEDRIGIFALRDIVPHEEITFDYKSHAVVAGGSAGKCYCGSKNCRASIETMQLDMEDSK